MVRCRSQILSLFVGIIVLVIVFTQLQLDLSSDETCACMRCIAERKEGSRFTECYKSLVPRFLSRKNSELSLNTSRWWQSLQATSERNYSAVVERLFSLFPDEELYSDAGSHRCRTCAVVGNSGNLEGSRYGPLIDAHDFVIRMNVGPTVGFEKDVGSRTTHRAIYPESAVDMDNSTHLILLPFKLLDLEWLISIFTTKNITRTYTKVKSTIQANKDKVMILHPEFMRYVYDSWLQKQGAYPSTGFLMLVLSLHICDQVSVFGFGPRNDGIWHHYFDKRYRHLPNKGKHKGGFEHNTALELHQKNKIQMYTGW